MLEANGESRLVCFGQEVLYIKLLVSLLILYVSFCSRSLCSRLLQAIHFPEFNFRQHHMPVAEAASAYVYEGVWTNWSKGRHVGATLTLSPKNALLLISITAIFIQLSGTQLWKVVQFVLHQVRATPEPRDGLYHQQQVILRNSSSELGALWQMVRIAFAWRTQRTVKSYRRSIPLVSFTLLHFCFFTTAGIFSSKILDAGDEVLSRSPFCGVYNLTYLASLGTTGAVEKPNHLVSEFNANAQALFQQSQQYVQFCSNSGAACRGLPQQKLPWNWTEGSQCPFEPPVCSPDLQKSIVIDTGLISSNRHLGLNAPERDRIQYRKVTTCTVLNDAKYISDWKDIPATAKSPAKRVVDAYYGFNPIADRNATYSYSEWSQYYSFDQYSNTNPYQINVQWVLAGDAAGAFSDFTPIPELVRTDADIFLAFLSFSKVYEAPVKDPWFTAQRATTYPTHDSLNVINATVYTRERPVTTLACAEQYQLCIDSDAPGISPDPARCTPLAGYYDTAVGPHSVDSLNLTAHQVAVATRVFTAATGASFANVILYLAQRDTPLLARRMIQGLVGLRLPNDQWQQEVLYWNSIAMAHFQRSIIDYSTGQFAGDTSYINTTQSPQSKWLCQNQIIRGTRYQSFSFFTMIFVLVFGTSIIIAGYTVEDCVALWRKQEKTDRSEEHLDHSNGRRNMWILNDMFEMLRTVHAWHGRTTWSHSSNQIPIAGAGQLMTIKDLPSCSEVHGAKFGRQPPDQELRPFMEEHDWLPKFTTSNASTTPPNTGRGWNETNLSHSNTFSSEARSEFETAWDHRNGFYKARTRRMDDTRPQIADGYGVAMQRETEPPAGWGENPRLPPLTPFWPSAVLHGRAY